MGAGGWELGAGSWELGSWGLEAGGCDWSLGASKTGASGANSASCLNRYRMRGRRSTAEPGEPAENEEGITFVAVSKSEQAIELGVSRRQIEDVARGCCVLRPHDDLKAAASEREVRPHTARGVGLNDRVDAGRVQ